MMKILKIVLCIAGIFALLALIFYLTVLITAWI